MLVTLLNIDYCHQWTLFNSYATFKMIELINNNANMFSERVFYSRLDKIRIVDTALTALTKYNTKKLTWPQTQSEQQNPSRTHQFVTLVKLSFRATSLQTTTAKFPA